MIYSQNKLHKFRENSLIKKFIRFKAFTQYKKGTAEWEKIQLQ